MESPDEKLEAMRLLREAVTDVASPSRGSCAACRPRLPLCASCSTCSCRGRRKRRRSSTLRPICCMFPQLLHSRLVWKYCDRNSPPFPEHICATESRFPISISCPNCERVIPDEPSCLQFHAAKSDRLFQKGRTPITNETRDTVLSDIPGLPPTRALYPPGPYLNPAMYEWMWKNYSRFRRADVILVNTFYDIEKPVLDALRNQVIGSPGIQVSAHNSVPIFPCVMNSLS